jgi:endopeptidase La
VAEVQRKMVTVALRNDAVLPDMKTTVRVSRPMAVSALKAAAKQNQEVFLVAQKNDQAENPAEEDLFRVGVTALVRRITEQPGTQEILADVTGLRPAVIVSVEEYVPQIVAQVREIPTERADDDVREAMRRVLLTEVRRFSETLDPGRGDALRYFAEHTQDFDAFSSGVAARLPMPWQARQRYLEICSDESARYSFLIEYLTREADVEKIRRNYEKKVRHNLEQNQKEYILREQMKVIRGELGEDAESDADRYAKMAKELDAPQEVHDVLDREIRKLRKMTYPGPEMSVIQNYIETLLDIPWEKRTEEKISIPEARKILDQDHYGLKEVKEQVLQYLAVRRLTGNSSGQILLLVGPPGTGKTSIAKSVAKALNRRYVRMSLGGVHDEAEIRGHRRTYVGAMPGRIVQAIRRAGVKNPLILLDELDKVGNDSLHGDTSSALLEVLDREQNNTFTDNYVEIPLDLSEVLFMATANTLQSIPRPLLDRMEVIEISGYTEPEKIQIGLRFLVPKQIAASGLSGSRISIDESAVRDIIRYYTSEAGVRGLERSIETVCHKAALEYLEKNPGAAAEQEDDGIPKLRGESGGSADESAGAAGAGTPDGAAADSNTRNGSAADGNIRKVGAAKDGTPDGAAADSNTAEETESGAGTAVTKAGGTEAESDAGPKTAAADAGPKIAVNSENLSHYLGKRRYRGELIGSKPMVGIVRGLAWTAVGGVTLEIEVSMLPGKGTVVLTGQMGDVMKESAQIALSYVRSVAKQYDIPPAFFEKHDIHLHIPEGAVPKDGPSAGVTMTTAILSAAADIPVRPDVAMTGEVTLRGRVIPIGGLREKLLASKAAGIRTVLVPEGNRDDLEELSEDVTGGLKIVQVSSMEQVLDAALVPDKKKSGGGNSDRPAGKADSGNSGGTAGKTEAGKHHGKDRSAGKDKRGGREKGKKHGGQRIR